MQATEIQWQSESADSCKSVKLNTAVQKTAYLLILLSLSPMHLDAAGLAAVASAVLTFCK